MARKKRNAKSAMTARWRQLTSWKCRSCRPRYPSRKSRSVCCPSPGTRIRSVRSPSCENISPYTVHAAGSAQYTHRHQIGIICIHFHQPHMGKEYSYLSRDDEAGEDVPEDEDEERQPHRDLDVGRQGHRHHPQERVVHEAHHHEQHEPRELGRRQLEPDHRVHDRREHQHLDQHVRPHTPTCFWKLDYRCASYYYGHDAVVDGAA